MAWTPCGAEGEQAEPAAAVAAGKTHTLPDSGMRRTPKPREPVGLLTSAWRRLGSVDRTHSPIWALQEAARAEAQGFLLPGLCTVMSRQSMSRMVYTERP